MKTAFLSLSVLAISIATEADGQFRRPPVAYDFHGIWYHQGDFNQPCQIVQRRLDERAIFINERGDRAEGFIRDDTVQVPEWGNRRRGGLYGQLRGNTIFWANGSQWSRRGFDF